MGFFTKTQQKDVVCKVIGEQEHHIDRSLISIEANKIITRLNSFGYQGYVVGGAVRDILLGRKPKDFDVVTDAVPNQIRRIFKNARIIGRRFRLVHIYFSNNIIETATFRANSPDSIKEKIIERDNVYGNIEDDVVRRDFSINALYYDPILGNILDFVDGYNDILERRIRTLKDEKASFLEDPVRMLRAVKYSVLTNCALSEETKKNIKKYAKEIKKCSTSRLYEEFNKIFRSGKGSDVFRLLNELHLLKYLIPFLHKELKEAYAEDILAYMTKLDQFVAKSECYEYELYWILMIKTKLDSHITDIESEENITEIKKLSEELLLSVNVPKKVIENLVKAYHIFCRYQTVENLDKLKKYRFGYSFSTLIWMYQIYSTDKELLDIVSSFNFSKKISKDISLNKNRTKPAVYRNKKNLESKRSVVTVVNREYNKEKI